MTKLEIQLIHIISNWGSSNITGELKPHQTKIESKPISTRERLHRNKNSNKTNEKIVEIANPIFGRNKQINKIKTLEEVLPD